jgi:galactose mutarotase-like enzyme
MSLEAVTRVEKDKIRIESGDCAVTILPQFGGKISSILVKGHELLQAPLTACAPRTHTMAFEASDASGWDECLPSVAGCTVDTVNGPVEIPDHGDLWRVAWQTVTSDEGSLTLRGECFSLPLRLDRTTTLAETEKGWRLSLGYTVTNTGGVPVPWSWSAHSLFVAEAGDRIVLPDSIHDLRLEGGVGDRLGKRDDRVAWPIAKLANGSQMDLSVAQPPESGTGDKLFAGPLSAAENWGALERLRAGVRIKVTFDPAATPYLGLWACYGGWPEKPGPKQVCVALEPATAFVDSLAILGPWSLVLLPGDSFFWPIIVDLELLQDVTHA